MDYSNGLTGHQETNFLEKAALFLPGIKGYLSREMARDSDFRLREHVAGLFHTLKSDLHLVQRKRVDLGRLDGLDRMERLCRKMDQARDTVMYAARGYSGLFDGVKIRESQLSALYDFDLQLLKLADRLHQEMKNEMDQLELMADLRPSVAKWESQIDTCLSVIDSRRKHLEVQPAEDGE